MSKELRYPPLIEVIASFFPADSSRWNPTVPGRLYEKLRGDYPSVKTTKSEDQKSQFWKEDGSRLVQVSPDFITVNGVGHEGYGGWESFMPEILRILDLYRDIMGSEFTRASLRYVNNVHIKEHIINLEDYFNVGPRWPIEQSSEDCIGFTMNTMLAYKEPKSAMSFSFSNLKPEGYNGQVFQLDMELFALHKDVPATKEMKGWLSMAHDRVESFFGSAFTAKTHQSIFGGIK